MGRSGISSARGSAGALTGCQVGPAGVVALSRALGEGLAPALCQLGLGSNRCGDEGVIALAVAVRAFPREPLAGLMLESNEVGDAGARALAGALGSMPRLHVLFLGRNVVAVAGLRALLAALHAAPELRMLGTDDQRPRLHAAETKQLHAAESALQAAVKVRRGDAGAKSRRLRGTALVCTRPGGPSTAPRSRAEAELQQAWRADDDDGGTAMTCTAGLGGLAAKRCLLM